MLAVTGRIGVTAITVRIPNLSVSAMDYDFCGLVLGHSPSGIDCCPLSPVNRCIPAISGTPDGPIAITGHYMLISHKGPHFFYRDGHHGRLYYP